MKWQFNEPPEALKDYHDHYDRFFEENKKLVHQEENLKTATSQQKQLLKEQGVAKEKLRSVFAFEGEKSDAQITKIKENAAQEEFANRTTLDKKKNVLSSAKAKDINKNDSWLNAKLKKLLGDDASTNKKMLDSEKQALEFEKVRRKIHSEADNQINNLQDGITQEKLECKSEVENWKSEQDNHWNQYAPAIGHYEKTIDIINKKHQPDIRLYQNELTEKVSNKDDQISALTNEINYEVESADNEIGQYRFDYNQVDRQFKEEIRMAKLQNRPTTRLQNSHRSRLNAINEKIEKVHKKAEKIIAKIEMQVDVASDKHSKIITKSEQKLNQVIEIRDQELSEPTHQYNQTVQERDSKISALQAKIDNRNSQSDNKISTLKSNINQVENTRSSKTNDLDQKMTKYVMTTDNCYDDMLNEAYQPFAMLKDSISTWQSLITDVKKEKTDTYIPVEYEKQKAELIGKGYEELINEVATAQDAPLKLSMLAEKSKLFMIMSFSLVGLSLLAMVALYFVKSKIYYALLIPLIIGLIMAAMVHQQLNDECAQLCKFMALASEYKTFSSIKNHSEQMTRDKELEQMRTIGSALFDKYFGQEEAKRIHTEKDADIRSDYERELKLIQVEFEEKQSNIARTRNQEIKTINQSIEDEKNKYEVTLTSCENELSTIEQRLKSTETKINNLMLEKKNTEAFINSFKENYKALEEKFKDPKWTASMDKTHGNINNELYIIQENDLRDRYNNKPIYKITHNKKPLVITYDTSDLNEVEGSYSDALGKRVEDMMKDLLASVHRMNSKDTYEQIIVDGITGGTSFKNQSIANLFSITASCRSLDEVSSRLKGIGDLRRRLAEQGNTIEILNEKNYSLQNRPCPYNIVYFVYRPDEKSSKLNENIKELMPDCDKYGFLPVFICANEIWQKECNQEGNMYNEIKKMINNAVVKYDGQQYTL